MNSRRQFLVSASSLAIASLLGGCGRGGQTRLKFRILEGSVSPQVLKAFRQTNPDQKSINFKPVSQLAELFKNLEKIQTTTPENYRRRFPWQSATVPIPPNLVTLGNGWYQQAIANQLIKPMPFEALENWQNLGEPWRSFLETPERNIYGIPYRWGTTLLLYRKDKLKKFDWQPEDWSDLWREDLKGKISLLNNSREVIGLVLKKLGYSYNEKNIGAIAELEAELITLHQNVKFYSASNYLQPLITGDMWLAQAWSQDALSLMKRYRNLGAVVPKSGTALWCDLWVQPNKSERDFIDLKPWLDFCGTDAAINQFAQFTFAGSPLMYQAENIEPKVKENSLIWLTPETYEQCEIIQDLPFNIQQQYQTLWQQIRQK